MMEYAEASELVWRGCDDGESTTDEIIAKADEVIKCIQAGKSLSLPASTPVKQAKPSVLIAALDWDVRASSEGRKVHMASTPMGVYVIYESPERIYVGQVPWHVPLASSGFATAEYDSAWEAKVACWENWKKVISEALVEVN